MTWWTEKQRRCGFRIVEDTREKFLFMVVGRAVSVVRPHSHGRDVLAITDYPYTVISQLRAIAITLSVLEDAR